MERKDESYGDEDSPFLLPFEEIPRCSVVGKGRSSFPSSEDGDSVFIEDAENAGSKEYFDSIILERTTKKLLLDGPSDLNHSGRFRMKVGQYVLLRPEENSLRPGVGKLITAFREKGKEALTVRVRWYYRGEDLTEAPKEAVGEDEVFGTQHFDDTDAESIAGRCLVLAYRDWILKAYAKQKSAAASLKAKFTETLQKDKVMESIHAKNRKSNRRNDTEREEEGVTKSRDFLRAKLLEAMRQDNMVPDSQPTIETRNRGSTNKAVTADMMEVDHEVAVEADNNSGGSDSDGDPSNIQPSAPEGPSQKTVENGESEDGATDDDIMSTFRANYPDSSLFYYCRRFYDPLSNTFLVSRHEDDNADPTEEIIALRGGREGLNKHADDEYREENENDSSLDEDIDSDFSSEDPEFENGRPKRKKAGKRQKPKRKRQRAPGVSQFFLPEDLGEPTTLPCRDSQKAHVRKFLLGAIKGAAVDGLGGSRCLYISGVPGTGKTATVREVIRDLVGHRNSGGLPPFEVVEVNAMTLPDPNLVYAELYAALTGNRNVTPMHAAQLLEKRFSSASENVSRNAKRTKTVAIGKRHESCTILILDEMDVLLARKQKVLYDMLEWPTRKDARMAVIGIANTMDLPERILPRIGSRLGLNRLSYPPYTSSQLQEILEMTLEETRVEFSPPAIQLCVKKIGSVSGDVRRALELCRRACEILLDRQDTPPGEDADTQKPVVKAEHMQAAIRDIAGGSRLVALNQLSLYEKVVLGSAISLARREGSSAVEKTCSMAAVTSEAIHVGRAKNLIDEADFPSIYDLEEACWRLAASRIVIIEANAVPRNSRIIVNVSAEDCLFALRECEVMTALLDTAGDD